MIKPIHVPQVSAIKVRTGLQSVGDLLPRLVKHYEMQAELLARAQKDQDERSERRQAERRAKKQTTVHAEPIVVLESSPETQQVTFAWYK